jgi:hypothetical protein
VVGIQDLVPAVDRAIAAGVGIAVELVGPVTVAIVDDGLGGDAADGGRAGGVAAVGHMAQIGHLLGKDLLADWEQVDQGQVGGEADRLVLVGLGPFGLGLTQAATQPGADRHRVVRRPGVVDRSVEHRQRPSGRRWPRWKPSDRLQRLLVPDQDHAIDRRPGGLPGRHGQRPKGEGHDQAQDHR